MIFFHFSDDSINLGGFESLYDIQPHKSIYLMWDFHFYNKLVYEQKLMTISIWMKGYTNKYFLEDISIDELEIYRKTENWKENYVYSFICDRN